MIGCITTYGLLPRALLLGFGVWRWRAGLRRVTGVDLADPYNQRLARRLDALAPQSRVVDPEGRLPGPAVPWTGRGAGAETGTLAAIGFELPDGLIWPVSGLPPALADLLRVDGSAEASRYALEQLAVAVPATVLVVLHAPASPDRGTARFLRQVAPLAGRCAIHLACPDGEAPETSAIQRWRDWLQAEGLSGFELLPQVTDVVHWLETMRG